MRKAWRDCKEWKTYGTPLSTASDQACKYFDAVLTQYVGWYEDSSLGGIENSINKMTEADPNFVMGDVLKNGIELSSLCKNIHNSPELKDSIGDMVWKADKQPITSREKNHVQAVKLWSEGYLKLACDVWEDILMEHPRDMLALKFAHDCYYCLSYYPQMRDSVARILPYWKQSMPLYGYILGMHAFGLEETYLYDEARKQANRALEINRHDAWATHALAHVYDMTGQYEEGIELMKNTESDWNICGMQACHNYWHWGLYHVEKGDFSSALGIFDKEIYRRSLQSKSSSEVINSVAFLYRLQFEGIPVKDKFKDLNRICQSHLNDHAMAFKDAHYLLASHGANDHNGTRDILSSIKQFIRNGKGDTHDVMRTVGGDMCEALLAFENEEYSKVVDIMYPKRYQIINMGGSHSQRDIFSQFLIHAAIKSEQKKHTKLAKMLLSERKSLKENSLLTDRLLTRLDVL